MEIIKNENKLICDECKETKKVNKIIFKNVYFDINYLCDKCLRELNYKIVEHLANENL